MDYVVTLVHGTRLRWTPHATWIEPESRFSELLQEGIGSPVRVYPFRWSGRNTVRARAEAARGLSEHLIQIGREHPEARRFVIGHSHGGNVLVRALGLPGTADAVAGGACLSTPFFAVAKRNFGAWLKGNMVVGAAVCVYSLRGLNTYLSRQPGATTRMAVLLTVVSAMIPLMLSLSMNRSVKAWIANLVARITADVELPADLPIHVLIVRSTGDEASALLAGVQFVGWLATRTTRLASDFAERMQGWFKHAPVIGSLMLFVGSFIVIGVLVAPSSSPAARWAAGAAAALLVLPTVILTLMLVISIVLLSILLSAYGPEIALGAPFLDVSVEPAPSGFSILYQLAPTRGEGLRHSATYQDVRAIAVVSSWLARSARSSTPTVP